MGIAIWRKDAGGAGPIQSGDAGISAVGALHGRSGWVRVRVRVRPGATEIRTILWCEHCPALRLFKGAPARLNHM